MSYPIQQHQPHPAALVPADAVAHLPAVRETSSSAQAAQAKALVEARYTVAMHRPRDLDAVRQRMLKECQRPRFADVAIYNKPVGNGIQGPSIRFAEMAIRCMGNITIDTATIYDDDEKRIVRVSATDLEANVPYSQDVTLDKTVERRTAKKGDDIIRSRLNSKGDTVHIIRATDDEILNKQNALISKAVRTLGLRLVPGDLIDECLEIVERVQRDRDAQDPDSAKRAIFDAFAQQGVSVDQLKEYLGHDAATLAPKELTTLRGLYAALRDGETSWREIMDARGGKPEAKPQDGGAVAGEPAPKGGNAALAAKLAKREPAPAGNPDFPLDDDLDAAGQLPHGSA